MSLTWRRFVRSSRRRIEVKQLASTAAPDLRALETGHAAALGEIGGGSLAVSKRRRNVNASTFMSEILTCRLANGREVRLLCKYGTEHNDESYGHRGGIGYEAAVYREVVRSLPVPIARYYGTFIDPSSGNTWLFLEYLEGSARIHETEDPAAAMYMAADWIGRFHAAITPEASASWPFLNRYDIQYYLGWVRRTSAFAAGLHGRFPWLAELCERAEECFAPLLTAPPTIIHGEYYPNNILARAGSVYPVDWESAALAAGEIDLASLTEGWPEDTVQECERAYQRARWPDGAPESFRRTFAAAQVYLLFRWLGDRPDWTTGVRSSRWLFEQLHAAAERLAVMA